MSCCCTNTLDLCKQNVCDSIDMGIGAAIPGTYKLVMYFLGMRISIEKEFIVGQQIIFPLEGLNEEFEFISELYDPIGDKLTKIIDGVEYNCFKFKTVINQSINHVVISS